MKANISRADADGDYVLEERLEDGRLVLPGHIGRRDLPPRRWPADDA